MGQHIQRADGKLAGSIGDGRDTVPTPARSITAPATIPSSPVSLVKVAASLARPEPMRVEGEYAVYRQAADQGMFGRGAGKDNWDENTNRCGRCDSRYCITMCNAGEPGFVYVTGVGHVPFAVADRVEARWSELGVDFGARHGVRRVGWLTKKIDPQNI
jgi:hypothetical protein